jgi:hypothetical protein
MPTEANARNITLPEYSQRHSLEQYRRFLTSDIRILDNLLSDLIHRRPNSDQRRTTARAVASRIRDRAEILRTILEDEEPLLVPRTESTADEAGGADAELSDTQLDPQSFRDTLFDSEDSESEITTDPQDISFVFDQLGDTSVSAFRAAIRDEAVELTVIDLNEQYPGHRLPTSVDNFHDFPEVPTCTTRSAPLRPQVDSIVRRHYSSVFNCTYEAFSEQVRLRLALRRSRTRQHE